jgi:hypothetical protein
MYIICGYKWEVCNVIVFTYIVLQVWNNMIYVGIMKKLCSSENVKVYSAECSV